MLYSVLCVGVSGEYIFISFNDYPTVTQNRFNKAHVLSICLMPSDVCI